MPEENQQRRYDDRSHLSTPNPDPTMFTTRLVEREIGHLRDVVDTRLDGIDARFHQAKADSAEAVLAALAAQKEQVREQLKNAEKAIDKAEMATEKRFESVNEFRSQLADQASMFMPRQEYDARHLSLIEQVASVGERLTRMEGNTAGGHDQTARIYAVVAIIAVIFGSVGTAIGILGK